MWALVVLITAVLSLAIWALWYEPSRLVVREDVLVLPGWERAHAGVRIALLSDLHIGAPHTGIAKLQRIIEETNRTAPDIVLIAGDLVIRDVIGGRFVEPETIARELARLHAPLGRFAVLGNHDRWFDGPRVHRALAAARITVLEDSTAAIDVRGTRLWIAGVSDYWTARHDVPGALAHVTDASPVVIFTHNPDIFPDVPARVRLVIAGHTHGGQVSLPLLGRPLVPSKFGARYAAGHIVENHRHLYVGTGIGTSILPVRFRVPPTIVILRLDPPE